jgi:hypothetical protein
MSSVIPMSSVRVIRRKGDAKEGRTDVIGVELVYSDKDADGGGTQGPGGGRPELRELARVKVVEHDTIELDVADSLLAFRTCVRRGREGNTHPDMDMDNEHAVGLTTNAAVVAGSRAAGRRHPKAQW